jgi:hypothetical protein
MTGFSSKRKVARELLESGQSEPVAYLCENAVGHQYFRWKLPADVYKPVALYTHPAVPEPNPWREAIDDELVCLHLGTADSFTSAKDALNALIDWHTTVAFDPEVSSYAQALIDKGAAKARAAQAATRAIAAEQAEDKGLWFVATTATEAHLQAALRRLTAAVEGEPVARTPLTNEQVWMLATQCTIGGDPHIDKFARAIEAAHGIGDKT